MWSPRMIFLKNSENLFEEVACKVRNSNALPQVLLIQVSWAL